ncbi:hypothetical protein [Ruegeria sp. ANG-S4]|nr:hypothetical protein [Ruegeria sp. ANG-S4]
MRRVVAGSVYGARYYLACIIGTWVFVSTISIFTLTITALFDVVV